MKEFNVTKDFSVTLFGSKEPLPKNIVYGAVQVGKFQVQYMYFPTSKAMKMYMGGWDKRPNPTIAKNARTVVNAVLEEHREEWGKLPPHEHYDPFSVKVREVRKSAAVHSPVAGSPSRKEHQQEMIFKSNAPHGSIDYEYTSGISFTMPENNKLEMRPDPFKPFSPVSPMSGDVPYEPKRDGMYLHDVLKKEKKEVLKISGEIHSRKEDALVYGTEYAAVNNMTLSENDAIRAYISGGLSAYARKKVLDQI